MDNQWTAAAKRNHSGALHTYHYVQAGQEEGAQGSVPLATSLAGHGEESDCVVLLSAPTDVFSCGNP